jgi:hypothetical protein
MDWVTLSDPKRVPYRNYPRGEILGRFLDFWGLQGPKPSKKLFFEFFDLIFYVSIRCQFSSDKVPGP